MKSHEKTPEITIGDGVAILSLALPLVLLGLALFGVAVYQVTQRSSYVLPLGASFACIFAGFALAAMKSGKKKPEVE